MPGGDGFSRMGVVGYEEGLPECSECGGAGEVDRMQSPVVQECIVETVHVC